VTQNNEIQSNIWKYYLATALVHFGFFTPIIQLFFLDNNLTITKIALLGVAWSIVRIILEVPSGILADKWGRKKVYAISSLFTIFQVVMLIYASNYWHFFFASILSAVSYSFLSGTNTAIFYDTLKQLKKEDQFEKLWARQHIFQQIPLVIAFVASGFLYKFSPLLPFQLSLLFLVASLIVVLTFKEPKYHKPIEEVNVFTHFTQSMKFIFENNFLKTILIFTVIFSIGSDLSYGYGQIYLKQLALPVVLFGIAYTFKSLLVTLFANIAPSIRKKIDYQGIFALQMILITALFFIMALTNNYLIGAICFILIAIPHGLFVVSKTSYIHKHTQSHHRATVDSMFSFVVALVFLILEPATGYLADLYTMKFPFLLIAFLLLIYTVYYIVHGRKKI
jgi:MFS family permease